MKIESRQLLTIILFFTTATLMAQPIKVGVFRVDASPPIGSPVAYAPARKIVDPLWARGVVILSDEKPVVLCSVDWLGIANEGLEAWQKALAKAARTTVDRVSIHAVHQHDGLRCDFTTARILGEYGLEGQFYDIPLLKSIIKNVAKGVKKARKEAQRVTHLGFGQAKAEKVASNRRILGKDGKVSIIRWSKMTDPAAIEAPEGLIDPWLKSVSFWNEDQAVAVLTYYATHPQSYYGQGDVTAEFVGMARAAREKSLNDLPHIHFNGASGNVAAGKYNDGSVEKRPVLARRMERAMQQAWDNTERRVLSATDLTWRSELVTLPLGAHLIEKELKAQLAYEKFDAKKNWSPLNTWPGYSSNKPANKSGSRRCSSAASGS